jgi:hypothetical protein
LGIAIAELLQVMGLGFQDSQKGALQQLKKAPL